MSLSPADPWCHGSDRRSHLRLSPSSSVVPVPMSTSSLYFLAQVGKTSLIMALVGEEFPEEVSGEGTRTPPPRAGVGQLCPQCPHWRWGCLGGSHSSRACHGAGSAEVTEDYTELQLRWCFPQFVL